MSVWNLVQKSFSHPEVAGLPISKPRIESFEKSDAGIIDGEDVLEYHRERILYLFGVAACVIVLPFSIDNAINGEYAITIGSLILVAFLGINSYLIKTKHAMPIALPVIIGLTIFVIGMTFYRRGIYGAFWTFPSVLFLCFSVSRRLAKIYAGIFFAYVSGLMLFFLEFGIAMRCIIGLLITIIFTNIFLTVIYQLRKLLIIQSVSDPLTGALNRRQLNLSLQSALDRKGRTGEPVSLVSLDIDNFKAVNDVYGHDVGDHVLKEVVRIISERLRRTDRLFRVGGEEFIAIFPLSGAENVKSLAEELRSKIENADLIGGRTVTVSIGICELGDEETIERWLKRSDEALYDAKNTGRNRIVFAAPSLKTC